jgi:hypothetical protein
MTIESPETLNTTRFQAGQVGTVDATDMRVFVDSLAGSFPSTATASFTFALTQRGTIIECNHATVAINATIPPNASVAFDVGTTLGLCRIGSAAVAFVAGAGVTFITPQSLTCRAIGSQLFARQTATANTWVISGDAT